MAMKIYEKGVSCLLDVSWVKLILQNRIEKDMRSAKCPEGLFEKTIPNGFLNYLGSLFFDMNFNLKDDALFMDEVDKIQIDINLLISMFDVAGLEFIETLPPSRGSLYNLVMIRDEVNGILDRFSWQNATREFRKRELQFSIYEVLDEILEVHQEEISGLRKLYASNFAERVFHDREYCEYISYLVAAIYKKSGFPVRRADGIHRCSQIERRKFPSWLLTTLRARERDKCAYCGKSISELLGEFQIDHIVPLSKFGFNDVVNLQLLCQICNATKTDNLQKVSGSIPEYFTWHRSMKDKQ
jgi:hypothetical protein